VAVVIAAGVPLVARSDAGADPADDERRALGENRREQIRLDEEIEDLEQSLEQLEGLIEGLDERLLEVTFELMTAERELSWSRRHAAEAQLAVVGAVVRELTAEVGLEDGMRTAYVRPPNDASGAYLLAADASDAGRRLVLIGAVLLDQQQGLDEARDLRERRVAAQATADDVALLAERTRSQVLELRAEVARLRIEQEQARTVLEARLEEFREEIQALAEQEASLVRLIRRLVIETARASGTAPTGLVWPTSGYVSSEFGRRWGRNHNGIDLAAGTGTPVKAAAGGLVTYAEPMGSFGNLVIIDHGGGVVTLYAHLDKILVSAGAEVEVNQKVATVGSTGRSTGPHLHFEVRRTGTAINPRQLLR
jgi:murein DD-endopeptidase MepM/ murein hydrolase activator NlpD